MNARQTISNYFSRPSLPLICISFALEIITLLIMSPVSPLIILDACNGNTSKAAIISGFSLGLGSLCGFFCSPILGILSDRYGRKPFLFINVVSVGINILGILTVYYTKATWVTFVSHAIGGCMSSIWAMSFVYVADITTEQDRSKSFGIIGATAGIAAIIGPGVASAASLHSLTTPLFIALGLMVFNLFFTGYVLPESRSVEFQMRSEKFSFKHVNTYSSYKLLFTNPFMILFAVGFCLNQITQFGILGTTVLYVKEVFYWSAWQAGIMFCAFGLFLMIAQGILVRPCLRYLGEKYTIQAGLLLTTIAVVLFGVVNGWATFAVIPLKALGSIATPLLGAYISKQFEKEVQGKVLGALGGLQTISGFIGPILFSSLYSYYTSDRASIFFPQIIFYVAGGCELLAFFTIGFALYKMKTVSLIEADNVEVTMITEEEIGMMPPVDKKAMEEPTPAVPEA